LSEKLLLQKASGAEEDPSKHRFSIFYKL